LQIGGLRRSTREEVLSFHRQRLVIMLAVVPVVLVACASVTDPSAESPSEAAIPSPAATSISAPTDNPSSPASSPDTDTSGAPTDAADTGESLGMALADADIELVVQALESYGIMFGDPSTANGDTTYVGTKADEPLTMTIRVRDGETQELTLRDPSETLSGVDEIGFLLGIFAPEGQSWLVEQLEAYMSDRDAPFDTSSDFDHVTLRVEGSTAETGPVLEMVVTDR
jgi:hypothetical protein